MHSQTSPLELPQPTASEIRAARKAAGLTQDQAAALISTAPTARIRTWASYEQIAGARPRRSIPLAIWELFLLKTGQHPKFKMVNIKETKDSVERKTPDRRTLSVMGVVNIPDASFYAKSSVKSSWYPQPIRQ